MRLGHLLQKRCGQPLRLVLTSSVWEDGCCRTCVLPGTWRKKPTRETCADCGAARTSAQTDVGQSQGQVTAPSTRAGGVREARSLRLGVRPRPGLSPLLPEVGAGKARRAAPRHGGVPVRETRRPAPGPRDADGKCFRSLPAPASSDCLSNVAESIRLAARIVDTPCSEMSTDDFLQEIREVGSELGIVPSVVRGEELHKKGFGGIYGVGKAARSPPALAVLSHAPEGATQTIAWIGSGIVYNTGGLTLKAKTLMPGAKRDCAGAAAVLGAFRAAVKQGFKENLHAVFCLAENSIGPKATRPDDILRLYSGKTVEVNNTDAGGRLALADGAVYASRDLKADIIVGIGNLTAAQGVVTGRYHAGLLTNSAEWEKACVRAGRTSGDLVHPLVFTPELHISEFSSAMADMKNFVSDRSNAQCSCAGLFLGAHIGFNWSGVWIDVDMGCPAYSGDRATGYGVAFLLALFGQAADDAELQMVSPLGSVADGHVENCEPAGSALKRKRLV
nr:PREDICTED: probable aminopeptidase NPEPL1 isoform X3 [Lepisosteus oculatus]